MKSRRAALILIGILIIAAVPWVINFAYSPLRPSDLVLTPSQYAPTEAAYMTRQAVEESSATSVLTILDSPTPAGDASLRLVAYQATEAVTPTEAATATATIPIPKARSITATPAMTHVELTQAEAQRHAEADFPDLRNPVIEITPDQVSISGLVGGSGPIGQGITIEGKLRVAEGKIGLDVSYVELNGKDITSSEIGLRAGRAVNSWLRSLQLGQEVQAMTVGDGVVTYDALQFQNHILPTPFGTPPPSPAPDLTGTPGNNDLFILPTESDSGPLTATIPIPKVTEIHSQITLVPLGSATASPSGGILTTTPGTARKMEVHDDNIPTGATIDGIQDATVKFTPDGLLITGKIAGISSVFSNANALTDVEILAQLKTQGHQLRVVIQHVSISGVSIDQSDLIGMLESSINTWLSEQFSGVPVDNFELDTGVLRINP